jgi:hypothetical protein
MKRPIAVATCVAGSVLWLVGCLPPVPGDGGGGLTASDFKSISLNGFDPADNAVDINDYAWSMEFFQPDGAEVGYVYVGTGNDMIGLIYQAISAVMGAGQLGDDVFVRPPEIRRYRGDIFPIAWERVFDYRDVETDPEFTTIGFRHMKTYRSQFDGVSHLYAATMGREATVWRTATGEPGSWEVFWASGETGSVRMMAEHNGLLYFALANEAPTGDAQIGKIFASDGESIWPVMEDSFGNLDNTGVMFVISYNGWLYAGTLNRVAGYEVWKLEGPDGPGPVQVVSHGGPSPANEAAITACVFQGRLYVGSMLNPAANVLRGFKAADIIRIDENDNWETVVGPGSISGYDAGFNHWQNAYIWSMEVHEGWLYVGTYDQVSAFTNMALNAERSIKAFLGQYKVADPFELMAQGGADLYKTQDGVNWYAVTLDGFGDVGNEGVRTLESAGPYLYVGLTNPFDGLEVWRGASVAP